MLKTKILSMANTKKLCDQYNIDVEGRSENNTKLNFKKLEHLKFDVEEARKELTEIIEKHGLFNYPINNNKTRYYYKGLSLTSLKTEQDKLKGSFFIYDENGNKIGNEHYVGVQKFENILTLKEEYEKDFELTEACTPFFQNIFNKIKVPITRVRILELAPGGVIPPHIDYPIEYGIKIHAYITTNDDVICEVAEEQFKIPSDGYFYWMDVSKPHSVINLGKTPRISLCINLNPYSLTQNKNTNLETLLNEL